MTTLTEIQTIISAPRLNATAISPCHCPTACATTKVVSAMLAKGLLEEVDADLHNGEPAWRETGDGHGITLVATDPGLASIGIEPEAASTAPAGATDAPREGTEQATLITMLRTPDGATIEEIMAAMSGALKNKLGLEVNSEKIEGPGRG